jgi:hypothetical protein
MAIGSKLERLLAEFTPKGGEMLPPWGNIVESGGWYTREDIFL